MYRRVSSMAGLLRRPLLGTLPSSPTCEDLLFPYVGPLVGYLTADDRLNDLVRRWTSTCIWVWKSEAVVYSLILLVTLGVEHLDHLFVEDGAVGWSCKCSSGRHCRRIGGHRSRDRARPSCSLSSADEPRDTSPAVRCTRVAALEFCVHGIVVHLRLGRTLVLVAATPGGLTAPIFT